MFKRYPTPQTVWMSCGFEGSSSSLSRRRLTCTDVTGDILPIFQGKIERIERGALDGLTREDIARFAPREDDYVLVSRLCDGSSVTFGESFIVDRLQNGICELEREGAAAIMVFCTGRFPETLTSRVPMIFPCDLLHKTMPLLTAASEIIAVTPSPMQLEQNTEKWQGYVKRCTSIAASPYGEWDALHEAARRCRELPGDLIVLDCIGFTQEMKNMFVRESGKRAVLPRTLLARVVSELTDVDTTIA